MSDDNEERTGLWTENAEGTVEMDRDWPGSVLEWLSRELPLSNGTTLVVTVEPPTHEMFAHHDPPVTHVVVPCPKRHVHVIASSQCAIASMNVVIVYAWAVACAYSEINWQQPCPDWATFLPWMRRVREKVREVNEPLASWFDEDKPARFDAVKRGFEGMQGAIMHGAHTGDLSGFIAARDKKTIN